MTTAFPKSKEATSPYLLIAKRRGFVLEKMNFFPFSGIFFSDSGVILVVFVGEPLRQGFSEGFVLADFLDEIAHFGF